MSERCETCRFWHTQDGTFPVGQPPGRCRREHPYGTPCGSADWCGEWKAKPYGSDEGDLSLDEIRAAMRHTSFDGVMVQERPGPDGYPCRLRDRFDLPRVQDLVNGRLVRVECLTCGEMFEEGGIYPCMQPQPEPKPEWDGSPVKTAPDRYKVAKSWLDAHGGLVPVDSLPAAVDVFDDTPAKPAPREPGSYWVHDTVQDWCVAQWDGEIWLIPGSPSEWKDTDFREIDERRIVRGG